MKNLSSSFALPLSFVGHHGGGGVGDAKGWA
jgi:hypothetical protein